MVQQKINKNIEPDILNLRTKEFKKGEKIFVVIFVPESKEKTHIISKDAKIDRTIVCRK